MQAELTSLAMDLGPAADRAGAPEERIMQKEEELSAKAEAGYAAETAAANAGAATALVAPNAVAMKAGEARQAQRIAEAMANARAMEPDVAEIAARHLDDGDARDGPYRSVDETVETEELPSDRGG